MITVSSIGDNEQLKGSSSQFFSFFHIKKNRQVRLFLVVALRVAAAEGNLKQRVSKATVHCVCPVNPVQCTKAEQWSADGGQ